MEELGALSSVVLWQRSRVSNRAVYVPAAPDRFDTRYSLDLHSLTCGCTRHGRIWAHVCMMSAVVLGERLALWVRRAYH